MTEDDADAATVDPVAVHWDAVRSDLTATTAEFEDRGWETLSLEPGDVTALAGEEVEQPGFDVLVPDDEFADLLAVVEGATFDASDVYATETDGAVFLLVAMRDEDGESAVLFPLYYRREDETVETLSERAEETGTVRTVLRPLQRDRVVTFEHDDPALFFPDEG